MLPTALSEPAAAIAERLVARDETLAVAESSAGGLVSAALLAVPGASAYFRGGVVIYTLGGAKALLAGGPPLADDVRSASEPWARWLAASAAAKVRAGWGVGETGAAGPSGNPYGDPAGHTCVAVHRPDGEAVSRVVRTGEDDRAANMEAFAAAALGLLLEQLG